MKLKKSVIALFLFPAVTIYLLIFLYPTVRAALMSFYEIPALSSKIAEWRFVGLDNYEALIHNSYFVGSVRNVIVIWIAGGVIIFILAFLFAAIISSGVRGKGFWRSLIFLPNTVSVVVLSVVWLQYIFNSSFGFLTGFFKFFGLTGLASIQWTDDQHIFLSMLLAYCFGSIGYFMLILGAGMDRIPLDYYEAALLEGAGVFRKFFMITLPLLRDVFRTTLVLWTISALNFFVWSAVFGLKNPQTMTPGYYMYLKVFGADKTAYQQEAFNVGAGATIGVMIMLAILALSYLINLFFRKDRLEY
ncbi:carbohydrate ABC transporter permease [Paenibacillus nasutitermitis]|uniref:Sugar ABC transporter ATP-binding protein n=1 Tax=Paenibacillus nasutitermitis TaxID=1652958 RepID=A0A917E237_9BACL|nr:sugar ABC transporter permease [Paenibacillus nasutitermitis]GGD91597.1 sugar ABC transporter ATP-binding protein [Paenibacillus nasutitermitis]